MFNEKVLRLLTYFGCQIWGQVTNTFHQKIFKLQNKALRIISFSDFRANSNPLYSNLKILKLRDQIVLQNCLFIHDALNNASPNCFNEYFKHTREIHPLNTRNANLGCLLPLIVVQCVMVSFQLQINVYQIGMVLPKHLNWIFSPSQHQLKTKLTKHPIESYD